MRKLDSLCRSSSLIKGDALRLLSRAEFCASPISMATIGDKRKTSNGCQVAERISRKKAGFRVPSSNIAAIDFGTTNCSVAYTAVGESTEKGQHLLPLNNTFNRVPTAILFASDGSVKAFGYDARTEYINLDDDERLQCAYFEQIKMNLQHDEVRMHLYIQHQ